MESVNAVIIVERRQLLREAVARLIGGERLKIVASMSSLRDVDFETLSEFSSVLVVMGLGNQPESALQDLACYRERRRSDRIVVLSDVGDSSLAVSAMRAGADAYLDEMTTPEVLLECLDLVLMGESILPSNVIAGILRDASASSARPSRVDANIPPEREMIAGPQLSPREIAVLGCLVEGSPNKVIARRVDMAEATVKVHVKAILRKIRVKNRTQAAIWAINDGRSPLANKNGSAALHKNEI